jgi:hypothetical protein
MTKLLEQAIEKIRELPKADQGLAADFLFALAQKRSEPEKLDAQTRARSSKGLCKLNAGNS